ncbi:MAG: sensor histidine kinase [Saprospiraceae bacterium]
MEKCRISFLSFFFCLHFFGLSYGQAQIERQRDSLLQLVQQSPADSSRVHLLIETGKLFLSSQLDSAMGYFQKAFDLATTAGDEVGLARAKIRMGYIHIRHGDFDKAFELCKEAIPVFTAYDKKQDLIVTYNNMGEAWNEKGNHWMAIDCFQKCQELIEQTEVPPNFPIAIANNLSLLYNDLRLFEKGLLYGKETYEKAKAIGNEESMGIACLNMANAYKYSYKEDEALTYFEEAKNIGLRINHQLLFLIAQNNIASILMERGQLAEAKRLFEEDLSAYDALSYPYGQMTCYDGLADIAFYQGAYTTSKKLALKAVEMAKEMGMVDYIFGTLITLSDIALMEGDFKAWKAHRKASFLLRDSIANHGLSHAIQELETKYETEQKVQQISRLEKEKEIDTLKIRQKNGLLGGLSGLFFLLVVLGTLGYRNQQHQRRIAEQEVVIQDQIIRELEQEKQLSSLDAMLRGQEEERGRLARDLHDGLGGMLSGIQQTLFQMKGQQILPETSATALNQVINNLDHSISELRHIARNMMPEALVRFGLTDALQDYCDYIGDSTTLEVNFQTYGMTERLEQKTEVVLFRIVQELLNNVVKHAKANKVIVQLLRDEDRLHLTVEDNGQGFDVEALKKAPGVGWINIQSRVNYLNGQLDLHALPGRGTSVNIECKLS